MDLVITNVSKQYKGNIWGLREFSLSIGPGVVGLLGPNGAGKSTLMRILATIARPTGGTLTWDGTDIARAPDGLRSVLGYLPQDFGVYPNLTPLEFLEYLAAAKGLDAPTARKRIDELLQLVNLFEARHQRLGGFSGGMRQRVGIAQALLNDPRRPDSILRNGSVSAICCPTFRANGSSSFPPILFRMLRRSRRTSRSLFAAGWCGTRRPRISCGRCKGRCGNG